MSRVAVASKRVLHNIAANNEDNVLDAAIEGGLMEEIIRKEWDPYSESFNSFLKRRFNLKKQQVTRYRRLFHGMHDEIVSEFITSKAGLLGVNRTADAISKHIKLRCIKRAAPNR